jgi:citrate (Re)-synthase
VSEIADYYRRELGYDIPPMTPLVGEEFTTTRAGIHADGLLKDEEIYNIFDTDALLNRPVRVLINQSSGAAGLVHWMKGRYGARFADLDKRDARLTPVLEWIAAEYAGGRSTAIGDEELEERIAELSLDLYARIAGGAAA